MKVADKPKNEDERLAVLKSLDLLDTEFEEVYDDLVKLAAYICDTPMARISLVDREKEWFKASFGGDKCDGARDSAFCSHTILEDDKLYIPDTNSDPRFADNPQVTSPPHIRFYCGYPLEVEEGVNVGALCALDTKPKELSAEQQRCLKIIANNITILFQARLASKQAETNAQSQKEMFSIINHELRAPLTSIKGALTLINEDKIPQDTEKFKSLVSSALSGASLMEALTNDLLTVVELDNPKFTLKAENLDFNTLIEESLHILQPYLETCQVSIQENLQENLPEIKGDKMLLSRVIMNLVTNAAKFSPNGETIIVSTKLEKHRFIFSVEDHGPGISEEQQSKVFKQFQKKASPFKHQLPGSGLGLNLAYKIAKAHKGSLSFQTKEGEGTTFTMTLKV